jgi:hypothetical protein
MARCSDGADKKRVQREHNVWRWNHVLRVCGGMRFDHRSGDHIQVFLYEN